MVTYITLKQIELINGCGTFDDLSTLNVTKINKIYLNIIVKNVIEVIVSSVREYVGQSSLPEW